MYNLAEICSYGDSNDIIIRDMLIMGCISEKAKDKIIRKGIDVTLKEDATVNTLSEIIRLQKENPITVG